MEADRFCTYVSAQESEVLGLAAATLLSKYRKMATFDELLDRLFFHGKAAVVVLLFFVGVSHMVSYLIVWSGVFALLLDRRIETILYERRRKWYAFGCRDRC